MCSGALCGFCDFTDDLACLIIFLCIVVWIICSGTTTFGYEDWTLRNIFNRHLLFKVYFSMARCINCLISIPANQQYQYNASNMGLEMRSIIEEWISRQVVDADMLCQECINLLLIESINRSDGIIGQRQLGHVSVCISCGTSIDRRTGRRSHLLNNGDAEWIYIANLISPLQMPSTTRACYACWVRARAQQQVQLPVQSSSTMETGNNNIEVVPQVDENPVVSGSSSVMELPSSASIEIEDAPPGQNQIISLEGYRRTSDSTRHCFVPDCISLERKRVPLYLKKHILTKHKVYVSMNARVCEEHSGLFNWDILDEFEFNSDFTTEHVVEMLDLLRKQVNMCLDFENVQNMDDTFCRYWTGLNVLNFLAILTCIPQLSAVCKKPKTALALYLVRLRTGEPFRRIASLFALSTTVVCSYVKKCRECLLNSYVPLHLGVNNIPRSSLSSRNLIIPQGLFGTEANNPIVIFDGTYVYLQKSSNYLFQKMTYSLHKFANLLKPFLLVTTDGHILDVFGPYAATTSDAHIMNQLFSASGPLSNYFEEGDVFLLDRGFRDAIGLLASLGYSIHKPEGLADGERQLSTINANKSRFVTLCRWVVEVVNGRFKRDFKIFRNKHFNVASKNLMDDFKISAAIINNFHPHITDRSDAQIILERALHRFNVPNYVGDFVIEHQLNRRRANFVRIDNAQLPHINMFPVMEMSDLILFSLGVYQIKQARSYYGEHIRSNGTFDIEICDEFEITNIPGITSHETVLLRCRIQSRHQSNKVYYTYILLKVTETDDWEEKICGYYCSCIIGKRTVGSCAHVMTIVWYLGWARHQIDILPPAQFLDNVIVRDIEDTEENE